MKSLFGSGEGASSRYTLPPFPNPFPERSLSLHCTTDGLYIIPARPNKASTSTPAFRRQSLSRTSLLSKTEDVAHDVKLSKRNHTLPSNGTRIGWGKTGTVKAASDEAVKIALNHSTGEEILCYGVVGILRVFNDAYLLVITSRTFAGDYLDPDRPVYKCSGILVIPLSFERAKKVFAFESNRQKKGVEEVEKKGKAIVSDVIDEDEDAEGGDVVTPSVISREGFFESEKTSRAGYATVKASKSGPWLSKHTKGITEISQGLTKPQGRQSTEELSLNPETIPSAISDQDLTAEERWHEATKAELEEKVVKETARQYSRGEMWFAYDLDLTTPLQRKQDRLDSSRKEKTRLGSSAAGAKSGRSKLQFAEPSPTLPLWRRADSRFWHNEAIQKDFVEAGLHGLVLPMMQGYFQVTSLPLGVGTPSSEDEADAMNVVTEAASSLRIESQLLIISRRSKERAGLRYQRRGVNEKGQVANYVETEQILYLCRGQGEHHALSFLQFRGSIPLFWKQDPFQLKPQPVLERNTLENKSACSKHFEGQLLQYGKVICINLAEKSGKEGEITKAYQNAVDNLNTDKVKYKGFDFHEECKGMKFENVGKLVNEVKDKEMLEMDCFWKSMVAEDSNQGETIFSRQKSVFRVSCLDCLDRTNVVQSAFGRYMLGIQLQRLGIVQDVHQNEEFDFAFNDAWANNGDMVSQIYAGTRALKGDFTRTGKRNFRGMMNDASNSIYRMLKGAVTDFFKQTVIDFQYGQTSLAALERYNDQLASQDPSEVHRLARVRVSAIETCARDILSTEEEKIFSGWSIFSPIESNQIASHQMEEKIILLTAKALYVCAFDFQTELLVEFSKIKVGDIVSIQRGSYIISPNEGFHPENYWGLLVEYLAEEKRVNTASMKNLPSKKDMESGNNRKFTAFRAVLDDSANSFQPSPPLANNNKWSFLHRSNAISATGYQQEPLTSHALIDEIVSALATQCSAAGGFDEDDNENHFIIEKTIQSLAEAKANASLYQGLIEGLKRRLWL